MFLTDWRIRFRIQWKFDKPCWVWINLNVRTPVHFGTMIFLFFFLKLRRSLFFPQHIELNQSNHSSIYIWIYQPPQQTELFYFLNPSITSMTGAVKYTDCITAEEVRLPQRVSRGPFGWRCKIHRLHLSREDKTLPTSVLDMTLNNLMVRLL